jgi:hypothetical protein
MASPHISASVLLLSQGCPHIAHDVNELQRVLQKSCLHLHSNSQLCGKDVYSSYPNNIFGYGLVNVFQSIKSCKKY